MVVERFRAPCPDGRGRARLNSPLSAQSGAARGTEVRPYVWPAVGARSSAFTDRAVAAVPAYEAALTGEIAICGWIACCLWLDWS